MLSVEVDADRVEGELRAGRLGCPGCGEELRPWGHARERRLRAGPSLVCVRPRRGRCRGCQVTHVLLPVVALLRRLDLVWVIGEALERKAAGAGYRAVAALAGVPETTAREWLRRFARRAEAIRAHFTRIALALDASVSRIEPRGPVADAVEAIGLAARGAAGMSAFPGPWEFASFATGGMLLANTSSPFRAAI